MKDDLNARLYPILSILHCASFMVPCPSLLLPNDSIDMVPRRRGAPTPLTGRSSRLGEIALSRGPCEFYSGRTFSVDTANKVRGFL